MALCDSAALRRPYIKIIDVKRFFLNIIRGLGLIDFKRKTLKMLHSNQRAFQIWNNSIYLLESFQAMKTQLREIGRVDHHPKDTIQDAMRGLTFDYYYSGQRMGNVGYIELSVTSILTDWDKNIYYRTCRYLGHNEGWKGKIKAHIFQHLSDLGVGIMLVRAMLDTFEVDENKKREWVTHTN